MFIFRAMNWKSDTLPDIGPSSAYQSKRCVMYLEWNQKPSQYVKNNLSVVQLVAKNIIAASYASWRPTSNPTGMQQNNYIKHFTYNLMTTRPSYLSRCLTSKTEILFRKAFVSYFISFAYIYCSLSYRESP